MEKVILEKLKNKALNLPLKPGVYLMKDLDGKIIYVGKAKALKNRVVSYFQNVNKHSAKTYALVSNIADFNVLLVPSEFEALLLECNLIKKHKPHYNILLKDDKGFPFIKITVNEDFPRVLLSRKRDNDSAKYYGPYKSSTIAKNIIDTVNKTFRLPTCNNTFKRKNGRVCLNHHIKLCVGLCNNKMSKEEYGEIISNAISFFEGDNTKVLSEIKLKMENASDKLDFEKAAYYRDCYNSVTRLNERQKIIVRKSLNADAISLCASENNSCINVLSVKNGSVISSSSHIITNTENESQKSLLNEFICRFYEQFLAIPPIIYTEQEPEDKALLTEYLSYLKNLKVIISKPLKGDGLALINISQANAQEYLNIYKGRTDKLTRSMDAFSKLARLETTPKTIELYDISQTSGTNMVAGMVVFEDGKQKKESYRRFSIDKVEIKDDLSAMANVVERRIKRYKANDEAFNVLPDLIIADGGINQVNAILKVLLNEKIQIPVIGLKKDIKHKTKSVVLSNGAEIPLNTDIEAFSFAGKMQEEVHRFAIAYHRTKRTSSVKGSALTEIEGIGKQKAKELYKHFHSIKAIKEAQIDELITIKGITKMVAQNIKEYFE